MPIEIALKEPLTIRWIDNGEQVGPPYEMTGVVLKKMIDGDFQNEQIIAPLKDVYIALSRAIEEGDQLKIGIVLGQTVSKLEELINQ